MHWCPGPAYPSRMNGLKLVIGSKNSSSWSLRPWLLLRQIGLAFEEILIPLRRPDTARRIRTYSPSGKVPVLLAGEQRIWDSLAIAEFLAEQNPRLWPEEPQARAHARCVCAEMHSSFSALRTFLPMDFTARFGPPGKLLSQVGHDIDRVLEIWAECREAFPRPGPFLFGSFTIVDAMFAPVCSRFTTYAIPLEPQARTYVAYMMALPAMQEWGREAAAEVARLAAEAPAAAAPWPWDDEPQPAAPPPPAPTVAAPVLEPPLPVKPVVEPAPTIEAPSPPPQFPAAATVAPPPAPTVAAPAASPPVAPKPEPPPTRHEVRPPERGPTTPVPIEPPPTRLAPRPPGPERPAARPPEPPPTRIEPNPFGAGPAPHPAPAQPTQAPDELRRAPRAIPSTIMVKPIGDGTRRRR